MSRKDVEAGRAHVLVYLKNKIGTGLTAMKKRLSSAGKSIAAVGGTFAGIGGGLAATFVFLSCLRGREQRRRSWPGPCVFLSCLRGRERLVDERRLSV